MSIFRSLVFTGNVYFEKMFLANSVFNIIQYKIFQKRKIAGSLVFLLGNHRI